VDEGDGLAVEHGPAEGAPTQIPVPTRRETGVARVAQLESCSPAAQADYDRGTIRRAELRDQARLVTMQAHVEIDQPGPHGHLKQTHAGARTVLRVVIPSEARGLCELERVLLEVLEAAGQFSGPFDLPQALGASQFVP